MHRSELRRKVLKSFYDKDDGRYHDPFGDASTTEEKVAIEAACRHLRDEGLIEWTQPIGSDFVGHGKITGQGATRYEQWGKPAVPNVVNNISFHGPANQIQIGDGNSISLALVSDQVITAIDASNASPEEKTKAKSLWSQLTNNQSFAAIVGAVAQTAMSALKGP